MLSPQTLSGWDSPNATSFLTNTYIGRYTPGRARGKKLVAIAEKATGTLRDIVFQLASTEIRSSMDSVLYRRLIELRQEPDSASWLGRVERENRIKRQQLEANLSRARSEAGKEPIRLALKDLGLFFQESGDGTNAIKILFQGKDSSSAQAQHLEMALLVMEAGLDFGNYDYSHPFALKAEQLLPPQPSGSKPSNETMKIRLTLGLCDLERKRYKSAAKNLLQIGGDFRYPGLVSLEDVGTIAVFCALATFSRGELKDGLLDNPAFKPILESVPLVKQLLMNFVSSKYGQVMNTLQAAQPLLFVDPFLSGHADALIKEIKVQALLQCVLPYSSLKLERVANAFESDITMIEADIAQLISGGKIQARIDSQTGVIVARGDDKREISLKMALETSESIVRESRSMLLRLSMLENYVVYTPVKSHATSKNAVPSMLAQSGNEDMDQVGSDSEEAWDMRSD